MYLLVLVYLSIIIVFNLQFSDTQRNNKRIVQTEDGSLFISRIQRQDVGNYTCLAKNIYGSDQITYELIVLGKYSFKLFRVFRLKFRCLNL